MRKKEKCDRGIKREREGTEERRKGRRGKGGVTVHFTLIE